MIVKKSKGVAKKFGDGTALTYLSRGKEVGVETIDIDGKAKGKTDCKNIAYITKGRGVITYNGKEKKLSKSYVLILDAETEFAVEGKFTAVVFKACGCNK